MDQINFISISAALFFVSFFFEYGIKRNEDLSDIIPFAVVILASSLTLLYTNLTVYKLAVISALFFKLIFLVLPKWPTAEVTLLSAGLTILAVVGLLSINFVIPLLAINIVLIIASATMMVVKIRLYGKTKKKSDIEMLEVNFLAFLGFTALSIGNVTYNIYLGLLIIILYQVSSLFVRLKHFHDSNRKLMDRLDDLENRFDRTVEFEAKKRTAQMADQVEHIREKSQKDLLSKALNRNGIITEINATINDSSVKIFSLAIFDIDFFKAINDQKGHIVGDECIKFLAGTIMTNNRKTDLLGRYGGDEFILLMPHVNAPAAIEICERLKNNIYAKSNPKFSISMGIATFPFDGRTFTELLEVADRGLYHAKDNGRNKVSYKGNVPIIKR